MEGYFKASNNLRILLSQPPLGNAKRGSWLELPGQKKQAFGEELSLPHTIIYSFSWLLCFVFC